MRLVSAINDIVSEFVGGILGVVMIFVVIYIAPAIIFSKLVHVQLESNSMKISLFFSTVFWVVIYSILAS